jgi:hypothetical protein
MSTILLNPKTTVSKTKKMPLGFSSKKNRRKIRRRTVEDPDTKVEQVEVE